VIPLHKPPTLAAGDEPGTGHFAEDDRGWSCALSATVFRALVYKRIDRVAVPGFTFPGEGEFSDLLVPGTDVTKAVFPFPLHTVQLAHIVGEIVLIGHVEDVEFLI
jgi:hypothetical protein